MKSWSQKALPATQLCKKTWELECRKVAAAAGVVVKIWKYLAAAQAMCSLNSWRNMSVCRQQSSILGVPCKFGAAILQMDLEIWSVLICPHYLQILIHHAVSSGRCIISSWRTIFSIKRNNKSWKWWLGPDLHIKCVWNYMETQGFGEA